jgi:hypothetical protein
MPPRRGRYSGHIDRKAGARIDRRHGVRSPVTERPLRCLTVCMLTCYGISYDGNGSGSDYNTDVWGAFYAETPKTFSWVSRATCATAYHRVPLLATAAYRPLYHSCAPMHLAAVRASNYGRTV